MRQQQDGVYSVSNIDSGEADKSIDKIFEEILEVVKRHQDYPDKEKNFQHFRALLTQLPNINSVDKKGKTLLHKLCLDKKYDHTFVECLLDYGANVNDKDNKGQTLLHTACKSSSENIVMILLQRGANVNAEDNKKQTPLHVVSQGSRGNVAKILLQTTGIDRSPNNDEGQTPLHLACKNHNENLITSLSDESTNFNLQDSFGDTPLHVSCSYGEFYSRKRNALFLLERGANPNIKNNENYFPFDIAFNRQDFEIAKILLNYSPLNQVSEVLNSRSLSDLMLLKLLYRDDDKPELKGAIDAKIAEKQIQSPQASVGDIIEKLFVLKNRCKGVLSDHESAQVLYFCLDKFFNDDATLREQENVASQGVKEKYRISELIKFLQIPQNVYYRKIDEVTKIVTESGLLSPSPLVAQSSAISSAGANFWDSHSAGKYRDSSQRISISALLSGDGRDLGAIEESSSQPLKKLRTYNRRSSKGRELDSGSSAVEGESVKGGHVGDYDRGYGGGSGGGFGR